MNILLVSDTRIVRVVLGLNVDHDEPKLTKAYKKRLESHIGGIEEFNAVGHAEHKKFKSVLGCWNMF
jgi:RNA-directed DNA polymerase